MPVFADPTCKISTWPLEIAIDLDLEFVKQA